MNLSHLFDIQRDLDRRIVEKKGLHGKDLIPYKIFALLVELGELSNAWRGFKMWSNDRHPMYEAMLEEYVDCLHFFLSIGNDIDVGRNLEPYTSLMTDTMTLLAKIYRRIVEMYWAYRDKPEDVKMLWWFALNDFLGLGKKFDFEWADIESAYMAKNRINHERQESGY